MSSVGIASSHSALAVTAVTASLLVDNHISRCRRGMRRVANAKN